MSKRKAAKAKAVRGIRNLPAKKLSAKQARRVKGGTKSTAGGGEGGASFQGLTITHNIDKSSPVL